MQRIEFRRVAVHYGAVPALRGIDLAVEPGEFLALLGPSGCGKTTLLRVIGGFVPYAGSVLFDGVPVDGMPTHRRKIGMVFQDYALFPHKTVRENIGFGLRMRKVPAAAAAARVAQMVALLHLDGFEERYPGQLSGGQQQRVALARAIAVDPAVLLLDEPLGALDKKLREEMQVELRQLQKQVGITTIFVTHDQEEALSLADRIAVMRGGTIEQVAPAREVYERPANRFVAEFIGRSNLLPVTIAGIADGLARCVLADGTELLAPAPPAAAQGRLLLSVRPEKLRLDGSGRNRLAGTVDSLTYLGGSTQLRLRLGNGTALQVDTRVTQPPAPGDAVVAIWEPEDGRLLNDA